MGWPDPEPPPSRARAARSLSPPKREVPRPPPPRRAPEEGVGDRNGKSWVRIDGNEKRIYIQTLAKKQLFFIFVEMKRLVQRGNQPMFEF